MAETSITCPHCLRPTYPKEQRCRNCGLTMLSDAEFALLHRDYWPALYKLEGLDPKSDVVKGAEVFPQLAQVADRVPFIAPHFEDIRAKWALPIQGYLKTKQVIRFHWLILGFFGLVAIVGGLFTRDWAIGGLLALPIIGWYLLGIHPLRNVR